MEFDLLVIGGGPAGVTAALRARELGASTALVEARQLGGTCTNDGCVPTRVLAKAARLLRDSEQFADYGLHAGRPALDFGRLLARTQEIVYAVQEKKQLNWHLVESGVTLRDNAGPAHFLDPHTVALPDGTMLQAHHIVICTGGRARRLDFPGANLALTHSDVWGLKALPARVAIVGAAATGCQLASVLSDFGSQVWLLDLAPRIVPAEDEHVSAALADSFRRQGITLRTGIGGVSRIERVPAGLRLDYTHSGEAQQLEVDAVILSVGWPGNLEALHLSAAGVSAERGYIVVDEFLRTSAPHIFAAGDITGLMMLVQTAGHDGRIAVENALIGPRTPYNHQIVPHGGFTDPEYGSVGLTEARARAQEDCAVALIPYADLDRAVIDGRTEGFCKLIASRATHRILGAHVVGEQAVEVTQIVAAGMAAGVRVEDLAGVEMAYPTFTAIVGLAARQLALELGIVSIAPHWRSLRRRRGAEWERSQ